MTSSNQQEIDIVSDDLRDDLDCQVIDAFNENDIEKVKSILASLHIADIADLIDKLPKLERKELIEIFINKFDPQLFVEIENQSTKERLIKSLGPKKSADLLLQLDADEAADIIDNLDEEDQNKIFQNFSPIKRKEIEEFFSYPELSAGRVMQKNLIAVPEYWNIGQAIDFMRESNDVPKHFYEIFVVDPKYRPIGSIALGEVMHHKRDVKIKDIMNNDIKAVDSHLEQDEVAFLFKQYSLLSVPIVNKFGVLIGAITIDEALLLVEKESEDDIMNLGGVQTSDFHNEVFSIVKTRFPWLFINLVTAIMATMAIRFFEGTIEQIVALAAIMPIVASLGGNAGTQTMTISVVALTSKEIGVINATRVIVKQIAACALSGVFLATIGGALICWWYNDTYLSLVFACSVVINFSLAGFFGSFIPILFHKVGIDPAIPSPIFLTALTDAFGFFLFLGLATMFLL